MRYINFIVVISVLMLVFSCGSSTGPDKTAADFVSDGWASFSNHDYAEAEVSFLNAIKADGKLADAYSGAGWSIAYQRDRYSDAIAQWKIGIKNSAVNADIYAGLTLVYQALDSLEECAAAGNKTADLDENYLFKHDERITIRLIHGVVAAAEYGLQNYNRAASQMDLAVPENAPHSSDDLKALLDSIMEFLGLN
jgi:tetratricopeptide (TPR) repeat protein